MYHGEFSKLCIGAEKTFGTQTITPFQLKSPQSGYSRLSHMDQKCMKFPAVLFSNYCHRCLPLNWPRLSQHALLVFGLTQLLPTAPLQTGA